MANETFGAGCGCFRLVVCAEAFRMELRFDKSRVAGGSVPRSLLDVTSLAITHPEVGRDYLAVVVTIDAIHHLGESQVRQAGAVGNGVVTGGAVQVVLFFVPEVSDVAELQIYVHARNHVWRNQPPVFGKAGVLDLLGGVTSPAIGGGGIGAQVRRHSGLRVARRTLRVAGERGKDALGVELVAEGTVRAKPRLGIDAALRVHVGGM